MFLKEFLNYYIHFKMFPFINKYSLKMFQLISVFKNVPFHKQHITTRDHFGGHNPVQLTRCPTHRLGGRNPLRGPLIPCHSAEL